MDAKVVTVVKGKETNEVESSKNIKKKGTNGEEVRARSLDSEVNVSRRSGYGVSSVCVDETKRRVYW